MNRLPKYLLRICGVGLALCFLVVLLANVTLILSSRNRIVKTTADLPEIRVGLLLGTDSRNGLETRSKAAFLALSGQKIKTILVSGNPKNKETNEPQCLSSRLRNLGVSNEQILIDETGVRTLSSLQEAQRRFPGETILIITDDYHVPRALWLADRIGLDAWGFPSDAGGGLEVFSRKAKESLARVKGFFEGIFL
jgi:SanA protein